MGASRTCSWYTQIEVSTQVPMVASQSQNGTKVPGPRLDWPCFARASQPGQTKRRSRSIPRSTPAPHRRFSAVASRKRATCCDSVPLSDSGRAFSVFPNHDHMADVAIRGTPDFHDCGLIIVVTVTNQCPRCNRLHPIPVRALCTLRCRSSVHVSVRRCATDFPLMSH